MFHPRLPERPISTSLVRMLKPILVPRISFRAILNATPLSFEARKV